MENNQGTSISSALLPDAFFHSGAVIVECHTYLPHALQLQTHFYALKSIVLTNCSNIERGTLCKLYKVKNVE